MDLTALSAWTGVRFKPDLANLAVVIESDRKLPFLEAIERKSRAARLGAPRMGEFDLAQLPQAEAPYKSWRTPAIDVQVQGQVQRGMSARLTYEALAAGEVLGLSYAARLAGSGLDGPDSLRFKLYRNDPAGELLGPLGATQAALGDVDLPQGALSAQSSYGRGAFVSNRPLNLPSRFGMTTLRGALPAGWDAELYRNGQLRAYQADRGDGRYEFGDIELLFGENDFEVVLHGPQGQIRRERSAAPVGIEAIPAGKTWYWAGIAEDRHDLIEFTNRFADPQTGWRWGIGVERGFDDRTSAGFEYQSLVLAGRRRQYLETTLHRALGPMLVELSAAQQLGAGRAYRGEALGKLGAWRFAAHAVWVEGDFESELVDLRERREFGLRLSGSVRLGKWRLPVEAEGRQWRARDGAKVNEVLLRGSVHIRQVSLTAELLHRGLSGPPASLTGHEEGTELTLTGKAMLGRLRLRGAATLGLTGEHHGMRRAQIVAEAPLGRVSTLRGGYDYDALARRGEYTLGYVRQFERFALRTEARTDNHGRLGANLTLAFSFGPDPAGGGWRMSRERLAETGQANITVFRDDNGDGYRQGDEEAVEGVSIEAGFRHAEQPTNSKGRAVIDGLRPYIPVLVSIDTGTLPDVLLQPKGRGVVVVPRPGIGTEVTLALAPTGEIEALLLGPDGSPRGGVSLELTDPAGRTVLTAASDFDGYVLFDTVPYGDYRLRLAKTSAAALGVQSDLAATIRIDRAHPSLQLGQLRLVYAAPPRVAAAP